VVVTDKIRNTNRQSEIGNISGSGEQMEIDKNKIVTQDELDEPAPIDQIEDRVEAEMKVIEAQAKEQVADGLQDQKLKGEAQRLKAEGERELEQAVEEADDD
jgi:hypothetical protein